MRPVLLLLGAFAGAVALATPGQAQNYPWCSNFADGWGGTNCGFASYEQCMATVRGGGGFCSQNNSYVPARAALPARQARRNRQSHKN